MIDTERLRVHLETTKVGLLESKAEYEESSSAAHRFAGGILLVDKILSDLGQFEVQTGRRTNMAAMALDIPVKNKVRAHGHSTSWEAAISQTPRRSFAYYKLIYGCLLMWGSLTDEELNNRLRVAYTEANRNFDFTVSGLRARRSELVTAGWVKDSGHKRLSEAGHPMIVWEAIPEE